MKIVNRKNEKFEVLFDNGEYCIVKNCETKHYSFGLWRDFYNFYYFPVNQSCLTLEQIKDRLNVLIKINKKYFKTQEEQKIFGKVELYTNMLKSLESEKE